MATSSPDFHHVTLQVSGVRDGLVVRNEHQLIKAVVTVKLSPETARAVILNLQKHLDEHAEGMDDIMLTLDGEFT